MSNTFVNLEVPREDGAGPAVDTALTGAPKSFIYPGSARGRFVVEGTHDGQSWAALLGRDRQLAQFTGARSAARTVDGVVKQVRVRSAFTHGCQPPSVLGMGAAPATGTNVFASIPVPTDAGPGAAVDLGERTGPLKTFIVGGRLEGNTRYSVLASTDGERFGEVLRLAGNTDRARTVAVICRFLRIERSGRGCGPPVTVGAEGIPDRSGGGGEGGGEDSQMSIADEAHHSTTESGREELLAEYVVPLERLPSSRLVAYFSALVAAPGPDTKGEATFRLLLGGKPGKTDGHGLTRLTISTANGEETRTGISLPFAKPGLPGSLLKVTGQGGSKALAAIRGVGILLQSADS